MVNRDPSRQRCDPGTTKQLPIYCQKAIYPYHREALESTITAILRFREEGVKQTDQISD